MLAVRLFGKFEAQRNGHVLKGFVAVKVRELFSYLLIHRNRAHPREKLATVFWRDATASQSKKYFRQTLWQLQTALGLESAEIPSVLKVDPEWIHLHSGPALLLDVARFEEAFTSVQGVAGNQLRPEHAATLRDAVTLYTGDLLEGCYQDWCLFERERLQNMYLTILDKLIAHCETNQLYEEGLTYSHTILGYDHARERTHWHLMRLYYLAGDRTRALRQYQRCVDALRQELGVDPSAQTAALYEQIRSDRAGVIADVADGSLGISSPRSTFPDVVSHLRRLWVAVAETERQVQREIVMIETALNTRRED